MTRRFPQEHIEAIWRFLAKPREKNPQALLQVDSYGCTVNAVAPDATAVPQCSSIMKLQFQAYWTDPRDDDANLTSMCDFYGAMYGRRGALAGWHGRRLLRELPR